MMVRDECQNFDSLFVTVSNGSLSKWCLRQPVVGRLARFVPPQPPRTRQAGLDRCKAHCVWRISRDPSKASRRCDARVLRGARPGQASASRRLREILNLGGEAFHTHDGKRPSQPRVVPLA